MYSRKATKHLSGLFLLFYIFMTLFQLVPVMCHTVMYPLRILSIIVQYLCSLFIILLFAYQLTMCCCSYCCEEGDSSSPASGQNGSPPPPTSVVVAPAEVQNQEPPTKHAHKWYMYGIQACMSLLGFALIVLIGFLYFAVTFMGVNPTTLSIE